MATIAAGSSVQVTVSAGEVLRVSGNAEVTRLAGMTESLNGSGAYGPYESTTTITIKAISSVNYSSETPAATDHVLTLAIDGITKNIYLYCDGSLSNTYAAAFSGGTTLSAAFGFGSQQGNAGAVSVACQFSGMHLLVMDGPLPTNHGLIAQRLAAQPHYYLTDLDFEF